MENRDLALEPFARAFAEHADRTVEERIAYGMKENAKYQEISFMENCMLPGIGKSPEGSAFYKFDVAMQCDFNEMDRRIESHPECREILSGLREVMDIYEPAHRIYDAMPKNHRRLHELYACWGGTWGGHGNPDYGRYLKLGTNGLRALIESCRVKNPGKDRFYDACRTATEAVDIIGDRLSALAAEKALTEPDAGKKAEYEKLAAVFRRVPREPAWDIYSAVQSFWLFYTWDGNDSPGRVDQFLIDYYRVSGEAESEEMIRRFLEAMHNVRGWNVCISGSDENWNDETNELSYMILRLVKEMGYQTPNLTMRVHRNTPEDLWKLAAETIGTGIGLPAIYNDEVMCPALEACGIPACDAHDYCMNGCNQVDIFGKSHMGLEDGEVNLAKVLEFALHDGYSMSGKKPELAAAPFGKPEDCADFNAFLALYYKQLDFITDVTIESANACQRLFSQFAPNPIRSCLIEGCLEKGRDYTNGGPLYNDGQVLLEGIADTVDSLRAIEKLIYEEKKYTMTELLQALRDNFEGHEALWRDFKSCEKFGNDIIEVDRLASEVCGHIFRYLKTKHTFRGGIYTGGCSPFSRAANNGKAVAALPNGKKKGEANFADSVAATPGCDHCGPTALVNSMLHYDQKEVCSGFVSQMKFTSATYNTEKGQAAFIALAKTYFANGGQQLSVNVLDRKALLAAREDPEHYQNLIVRVGGYSDYFVRLSPELQQNVIDRTDIAL